MRKTIINKFIKKINEDSRCLNIKFNEEALKLAPKGSKIIMKDRTSNNSMSLYYKVSDKWKEDGDEKLKTSQEVFSEVVKAWGNTENIILLK